ncbi:MAG: hypothetical protein M3Q07_10580 [Pseudobdellovibrionaceae bacterium]|nr:hypothetical protein [Pseudobdellovibrionaceae bacterium]
MKISLILACQLFASSVALGADAAATQPAAAAPAAQTMAPTEAIDPETPAAASANAMEAVCKLSGNTRRVKMDMSNQKCQVLYYKETEMPGTENKLWEFNHEFEKCKESYSGFVDKLRGMSWTCS